MLSTRPEANADSLAQPLVGYRLTPLDASPLKSPDPPASSST
ncbi:hypothetical protein [Nostoc sp.]